MIFIGVTHPSKVLKDYEQVNDFDEDEELDLSLGDLFIQHFGRKVV